MRGGFRLHLHFHLNVTRDGNSDPRVCVWHNNSTNVLYCIVLCSVNEPQPVSYTSTSIAKPKDRRKGVPDVSGTVNATPRHALPCCGEPFRRPSPRRYSILSKTIAKGRQCTAIHLLRSLPSS